MHLMMLDVYFKGKVWRALQHIVLKAESTRTEEFKLEYKEIEYLSGLEFITAISGSPLFQKISDIKIFLDHLKPENRETAEGQQCWEQLKLWIKLYSGLNNIKG
jgi:hypothetical protein